MSLRPLPVTDTRPLFRPAAHALLDLLAGLEPGDWQRPTVAGSWRVRDVVAHLVDTALRRLTVDRDGQPLPPPPMPIRTERGFVTLINTLNAEWVRVAQRLSPAVLVELYRIAGLQLASYFESAALDAPARFPVSWAGEAESQAWFDIGREFTEVWHHQMQIRDAVSAPLDRPEWLRAVLEIAIRVLPHAFRAVEAAEGAAVVVDVTGTGGGQWTLQRERSRWTLMEGSVPSSSARAALPADVAWKLLFNAIPLAAASEQVAFEGDQRYKEPLLAARSVIV
ncbi:MAG TPA: maleylpyruvate isomerase N-terminal domain-containing protein [Vicinamibacterales bacterium]|nr:maleylpyruvate isomerase N-terminal domain-containing protein [Vicinamibacterales bacterium]